MAYYALKKDVFDINKVTVVGNPTITSNGVASGFDSANANNIQIPTAIISQIATANTWKAEVSGTVQESGFTYGNIRTDNNIRYDLIQLNRYTNGFMFVCCLDENGTATSKNIPITFTNTYNGKAYKATLEFTGTKYIATVQFEDGKVLTNSLDNSYKIKFYNFGDKFELGYKCINGSINLKDFKIYVDNQLVFQPVKPTYLLERRKQKVWNKGQFTIVGNPSISESGVASGFSVSNYITTPKIVSITNTSVLKLVGRFKTSTLASRQVLNNVSNDMGSDLSTSKITLRFETNGTSSGFITNADGIQVASLSSSNIKIQANTEYDFSFKLDGLSYEFKVGDSTLSGTLSNYLSEGLYIVSVGKQMYIYHSFWLGSIDLPSISITVDSKEVFTGAKEVYYAMEK